MSPAPKRDLDRRQRRKELAELVGNSAFKMPARIRVDDGVPCVRCNETVYDYYSHYLCSRCRDELLIYASIERGHERSVPT